MVGSSAVLLLAGLACLFAPIESFSALGFTDASEIAGQIVGALYLAFAAANWTARGSMIGGIYARPLAVANFVHFVIGATVLAKGISTSRLNAVYLAVTLGYLAFAIMFILVLYGRLERTGNPQSRR
jgi:hypothetical protein